MDKYKRYAIAQDERGYVRVHPYIPKPKKYQDRFWKFVKKLRKEYEEER